MDEFTHVTNTLRYKTTGSSLLFFGEVSVLMYDLFVLGEACLRCYRWLEKEKKKQAWKAKTQTHTNIKLKKAPWQNTRR